MKLLIPGLITHQASGYLEFVVVTTICLAVAFRTVSATRLLHGCKFLLPESEESQDAQERLRVVGMRKSLGP